MHAVPPELPITKKSVGLYMTLDGRFEFHRRETCKGWHGEPVYVWDLRDALRHAADTTFQTLRNAREAAAYQVARETVSPKPLR